LVGWQDVFTTAQFANIQANDTTKINKCILFKKVYFTSGQQYNNVILCTRRKTQKIAQHKNTS